MRLREPLNGFRLASGHLILHIAFLIGSYFAVDTCRDHRDDTK